MDYINELRVTVNEASKELKLISELEAGQRSNPGKWSPKEIIGHLIDSASNNHGRFVKAQFKEDLIFPGYEQEKWVITQNYQGADWHFLIDLWRNYNLHLANVMQQIPRSVSTKKRIKHNLHQIAWKTVPENTAVTLDYFMNDYVGHLKHHLRQVLDEGKKELGKI